MTKTTETAPESAQVNLWWMVALRGGLLLIFGLFMFTWGRGPTLLALIQVLGAYWLVGGVFDVAQGVMGKTKKDRSRVWAIVGGIISIVAGFFVMGHPAISGLMAGTYLSLFMGISAMLVGVAQMFSGRKGMRSVGSFVMGIFSLIFGLLVIMNPLITQAVVVAILPFWAVLAGLSTLFSSFRMRGPDGEPAVAEGRG